LVTIIIIKDIVRVVGNGIFPTLSSQVGNETGRRFKPPTL
jgi:hypothetical protein